MSDVTLISVHVQAGYKPEDGDAFDAVLSALEHFNIPTYSTTPKASKADVAANGMKIRVEVQPEFKPEDGDAFEAVVSALDHFEIPAYVQTSNGKSKSTHEKLPD